METPCRHIKAQSETGSSQSLNSWTSKSRGVSHGSDNISKEGKIMWKEGEGQERINEVSCIARRHTCVNLFNPPNKPHEVLDKNMSGHVTCPMIHTGIKWQSQYLNQV